MGSNSAHLLSRKKKICQIPNLFISCMLSPKKKMLFCGERVYSSPVATFRNVFFILFSAYRGVLYIAPTWLQEHPRGKRSVRFLCSVHSPAQRRQALTCVMRQFWPIHLNYKAKQNITHTRPGTVPSSPVTSKPHPDKEEEIPSQKCYYCSKFTEQNALHPLHLSLPVTAIDSNTVPRYYLQISADYNSRVSELCNQSDLCWKPPDRTAFHGTT